MSTRTAFVAYSETPTALLAPATVTTGGNGTGVLIEDYEGLMLLTLNGAAGTSTDFVTNGGFDSDSTWSKGTGWSIGAGVATFAGHTTTSDLSEDISAVQDTYYTVIYTVSNYTAGSITASVAGTAGTARSANGTYSEVIKAGATGTSLALTASSTFRGKVDNVVVYDCALDVHIEHSSDDSSYADVTGAAFDTIYGIADCQKLILNTDELKKYIRPVTAGTGTSRSFVCSLTASGVKKY